MSNDPSTYSDASLRAMIKALDNAQAKIRPGLFNKLDRLQQLRWEMIRRLREVTK